MNFKKTVAIATAAGALAAISVPAMALENEFHGMYRMFGYMTNALSGGGAFNLAENSRTDKFFEQRARLQYTAKASDDLKLVTHFELDTKFGGSSYTQGATNKYPLGDAGALDADRITLETKNVYLDFNCPITGANVKAGIQPFNDALAGNFGNFDGAGITASKKFGDLTATYGYFTVANTGNGTAFPSNDTSADLNVLDAKFALSKDITVGASYYNVLSKPAGPTVVNNTVGLNATAKLGPASLSAAAGLQFGKTIDTTKAMNTSTGTTAFAGNVAAKINAGPGSVNLAAIYLSGDNDGTGYNKGWQPIRNDVTYFTPANMWLITRNAATINSSTAIGASSDLTRGGRGIAGVFAGYEGKFDKLFYNANVGYAQVAAKQSADSAAIGTEFNVTAGYKLYSNLSVSATAAYAVLGDGYGKDNGTRLPSYDSTAKTWSAATPANADNPFLTNVALNYTF